MLGRDVKNAEPNLASRNEPIDHNGCVANPIHQDCALRVLRMLHWRNTHKRRGTVTPMRCVRHEYIVTVLKVGDARDTRREECLSPTTSRNGLVDCDWQLFLILVQHTSMSRRADRMRCGDCDSVILYFS